MKDRYFTALADERRRDLLLTVQDERIHQVDTDSGETATRLTHVHLPMLEDAGLVRWDRDAGTIAPGANYDELEPVISVLQARAITASD